MLVESSNAHFDQISPSDLRQHENDWAMPDKRWVGKSFSRSASDYDRVASLQRHVGEGLLKCLPEDGFVPQTILDLGSGTGYCTAQLAKRFPDSSLIALDIAMGMLKVLGQRHDFHVQPQRVCADIERLPLKTNSVDLVFSNLALQWCSDLPAVLAEFKRVLRPGGLILFSTFGESTLYELRDAWAKAESRYTHVNGFKSKFALESALAGSHFAGVSVQSERFVLEYPSVDAILRELKQLGAHNVTNNRPRHLTGKGVFGRMLEAYSSSMVPGHIKASFEIVMGMASQTVSVGNEVR